MQADEEVNDHHQNPNDGEDNVDNGEDVNNEDESYTLCRQIIDNTARERVVDLAERLDISIPQCHEAVWIRSKYPCIKRQVADCFSSLGIEGVELLQSVITNLTNANYNYREVNRLLVDAGLIGLDSDISIQSENSNEEETEVDDTSSTEEDEGEGGIGDDDNNFSFLPVGDWSDESDHQSVNEGNGEVGNVENVNPGEPFGDDISGDNGVHPRTRNTSPNDVTDTREFINAQEEPTNSQLAESAGCRYIEQEMRLLHQLQFHPRD